MTCFERFQEKKQLFHLKKKLLLWFSKLHGNISQDFWINVFCTHKTKVTMFGHNETSGENPTYHVNSKIYFSF